MAVRRSRTREASVPKPRRRNPEDRLLLYRHKRWNCTGGAVIARYKRGLSANVSVIQHGDKRSHLQRSRLVKLLFYGDAEEERISGITLAAAFMVDG